MTEMQSLRHRLIRQPGPVSGECWIAFFDGVAHPVLIKNAQGQVIFANRAACDLLGRDRSGLAGGAEHELVAGTQAEQIASFDAEAMRRGSVSAEQEMPGPRGVRRFLVSRRPAGEHLVVTFFEITDLRETEGVLRQREAHLRNLLELHPVAPFSFTADGVLSDLSDRLVAITGLPAGTRHVDAWWAAMHPCDRRDLRRAWIRSVRGGSPSMPSTGCRCRTVPTAGSGRASWPGRGIRISGWTAGSASSRMCTKGAPPSSSCARAKRASAPSPTMRR